MNRKGWSICSVKLRRRILQRALKLIIYIFVFPVFQWHSLKTNSDRLVLQLKPSSNQLHCHLKSLTPLGQNIKKLVTQTQHLNLISCVLWFLNIIYVRKAGQNHKTETCSCQGTEPVSDSFSQKAEPYMRTQPNRVKENISCMHLLYTSQVTEIDLYLVISFFNFFFFFFDTKWHFHFSTENPCQNSTCLFQLYHWSLLWPQTLKNKQKMR